jgi:hypothetical protein
VIGGITAYATFGLLNGFGNPSTDMPLGFEGPTPAAGSEISNAALSGIGAGAGTLGSAIANSLLQNTTPATQGGDDVFGAAGPKTNSSTGTGFIDATNTSRFPGVTIHIDNGRDQGYFNPFTKTIHIPGAYENKPLYLHDYEMHEYGHYLQLDALQTVFGDVKGMSLFISKIMIPSMLTSHSADHMMQWYEINANDLSKAFTGDKFNYPGTFITTPN